MRNSKNKSGLSQVVSTILLILLTLAAVAAAASIITNFVRSGLDNASACKDVLNQVKLNPDYTCYDLNNNTLIFSILRSDFSMDSLLVAASGETTSRTFSLTGTSQTIQGLINYKTKTTGVTFPDKEAGKTYCLSNLSEAPTSLEISPKISGVQCSVTDSMKNIPPCSPALIANC